MEDKVAKGIGFGCIIAVAVLILGTLAFTLVCGLMMNGCVKASAIAQKELNELEQDDGETRPEEPGRFDKVWVSGSSDRLAPKVLRIKLSGVITDRQESNGLFSMEDDTSAPAALKRIRAATRDKSIAGILLEVDSPGGGVTMSDIIHDALLKYKRADTNRFIAVYMGDLCCSGGYYISAAADRIFARPTTITGSIGVIMHGVNIAGLAKKIGIADVTIASGENKDILNPLKEVNPEHVALLRKPIEEMYERFVGIVAKGRGMPVEKVRKIADGRIFSAEEAHKLGLVDGVFHDDGLQRELKRLAGGEDCRIVRYKSRKSIGRFFDNFVFEQARAFMRGIRSGAETDSPRQEYRWR